MTVPRSVEVVMVFSLFSGLVLLLLLFLLLFDWNAVHRAVFPNTQETPKRAVLCRTQLGLGSERWSSPNVRISPTAGRGHSRRHQEVVAIDSGAVRRPHVRGLSSAVPMQPRTSGAANLPPGRRPHYRTSFRYPRLRINAN